MGEKCFTKHEWIKPSGSNPRRCTRAIEATFLIYSCTWLAMKQQERKQWTKRQQIIHSYGNQEEDLSTEREEIVDSDSTVYSHIGGVRSMQGDGKGILIVMGRTTEEAGGGVPTAQPSRKGKERKPCKCSSRTHSRVSFNGCPLNKLS